MANIWADILTAAGITPNPNAEIALALWSQGEGGLSEYVEPGNPASGNIWNPFNITASYGQPTVGQGGTQGNIQYFSNQAAGVKASAQWLSTEPYLRSVMAALATGDLGQIYTALNAQRTTMGGSTVSSNYPPLLAGFINKTQPPPSGNYSTGLSSQQLEQSQANQTTVAPTTPQNVPVGTTVPNSPGTSPTGINQSTSITTPAPPVVPYTGPDIFKLGGQEWNITEVPPADKSQAYAAIQKFVSTPGADGMAEQEATSLFGYDAWFMQNPELKSLLVYGAERGLTNDNVMGMIYKTTWWQTTDANQRYFEALQGSDPSSAAEMVRSAAASVEREAATLGVTLTPAEVQQMAYRYASTSAGSGGTIPDTGFNADQLAKMVATQYNYKKMGLQGGGDVSTLSDDYQKLAGQYMIPMSQQAIGAHVQAAIHNDQGQTNFTTGQESAFETYLKQQAINKYPYMAASINSGITPYQWADPYRQEASQILEKNPNEIDMNSPEFQFALTDMNPKTGEKQPMSLAQFRTNLMSNPKYGYQYTNQAQTAAWSTGAELLRAFGAISGSVA